MYVLRRIFKVKEPRDARQVASLLQKQAQIYHDSGQRSEFKVYFNGGTVPGEPGECLEMDREALCPPCGRAPVAGRCTGDRRADSDAVESNRIEFHGTDDAGQNLDV